VNPADLEALGLEDGDVATIESPHGRTCAVLRAAGDIAPGTVSIAHCWGGATEGGDVRAVGSHVNALINNEDPISDEIGMARQSAIPVRILPIVRSPDLTRK
jgi:anaerobic selenocysteine-containing dehydrogenase